MKCGFLELVDLASERVGGAAVAANDEFFAPKESLVRPEAPVWREGAYTDRGKWMDGWETRRRRDVLPGEPAFDAAHDWCIVRLGARGLVFGADVETSHFKGNFPESCSVEACVVPGADSAEGLERAEWQHALVRSPLRGDAHNLFHVAGVEATHVRLNIFPDGGVARLRVFGAVLPDWDELRRHADVDLASVLHGGQVVACSDMFFGSRHNLIMPGDGSGMADGWETRRRRRAGHDWIVIKLGAPGSVRRVEVDTRHFKGNAPAACAIEGLAASGTSPDAWERAAGLGWLELVPRTALRADSRHTFQAAAVPAPVMTHVRLTIFPDGGVSRLRLFGTPA